MRPNHNLSRNRRPSLALRVAAWSAFAVAGFALTMGASALGAMGAGDPHDYAGAVARGNYTCALIGKASATYHNGRCD